VRGKGTYVEPAGTVADHPPLVYHRSSDEDDAMKFKYYEETDSLYIDLSEKASADSREVAPGVVLGFDGSGRLVGIDIDHASHVVNLSHIEAETFPFVRRPAARSRHRGGTAMKDRIGGLIGRS
jgi:uncharacterized protein YuzE